MASNNKVALVTGITGQDGSYLSEFLLAKGYVVHGLVRRSSSFNTSRIDHLNEFVTDGKLVLHHSDLLDNFSLSRILSETQPDEIYNLAAQSHVRVSFELPMTTSETTGLGCLAVLEAVRLFSPKSRIYQASSSEMFGSTPPPQSEETPFHPRSPYGVSKVFAYWMTRNYRESYGLHASNGILFNHESPRRSPTFVTRKLTRAAARIASGLESSVSLGNLSSSRDWGYAPEYILGMWLMLQQDQPDDIVLGTGVATTVEHWGDLTFQKAGIDFHEHFVHNEKYDRPSEVDALLAATHKAKTVLQWRASTTAEQLIERMLAHDFKLISNPNAIDEVNSELWTELLS